MNLTGQTLILTRFSSAGNQMLKLTHSKQNGRLKKTLGCHSHTIQVTILAFLCFSLSSYDLFQHLVKVLLYHSLALQIISLSHSMQEKGKFIFQIHINIFVSLGNSCPINYLI